MIRKYLGPYMRQIIVGPLFKLIEAVLEMLMPFIMAKLIDTGDMKLGILLGVDVVLGLGCAVVCQYMAAKASVGYGDTLRKALYNKIGRFTYSDADRYSPAFLSVLMTNDVNAAAYGLALAIRLLSRVPFIIICSVVMILMIKWEFWTILAIAVPVFMAVVYTLTRFTLPMFSVLQRTLDALSGFVSEYISGIKVIRAFNRAEDMRRRFTTKARAYKNEYMKINLLSALSNPVTTLIVNIAIVFMVRNGLTYISDGTLTKGEIIACTGYLTQIMLALIVFSGLLPVLSKALVSGGRINNVLDGVGDRRGHYELGGHLEVMDGLATVGDKQLDTLDTIETIEFERVSFGYYKNPVFEDVSLTLRRGETLGLKGATGSGKSTLLLLLGRYYEPHSGQIKLNGTNIKSYHIHKLRKAIAIVPQIPTVYNMSVYDNIDMGRGLNENEIKSAANLAQADEFISKLPDGYKTVINNDLSGGQKQRIAIARALAGKPDLLILDDCTAQLDNITEARILDAIDGENIIKIIVSQREHALERCARVLTIKNGRLDGDGV